MVMSSLTASKKVLRALSRSLRGFQVLLLWKGVSYFEHKSRIKRCDNLDYLDLILHFKSNLQSVACILS